MEQPQPVFGFRRFFERDAHLAYKVGFALCKFSFIKIGTYAGAATQQLVGKRVFTFGFPYEPAALNNAYGELLRLFFHNVIAVSHNQRCLIITTLLPA
jgi:hypothetical protein